MKKRLPAILLFLLSVTALLIAFKQTQHETTDTAILSQATPIKPTWQLYETTSWQIPAPSNGQKQQTAVYANEIQYHKKTQQSFFKSPFIIDYRIDNRTSLSSQLGKSLDDQTLIFNGNVKVLVRNKNDSQENKTLTSEEISYNTLTKQITSQVFTQMTQANLTISGTGFKADNGLGTIEFISDVKTRYQPKQTHHNQEHQ